MTNEKADQSPDEHGTPEPGERLTAASGSVDRSSGVDSTAAGNDGLPTPPIESDHRPVHREWMPFAAFLISLIALIATLTMTVFTGLASVQSHEANEISRSANSQSVRANEIADEARATAEDATGIAELSLEEAQRGNVLSHEGNSIALEQIAASASSAAASLWIGQINTFLGICSEAVGESVWGTTYAVYEEAIAAQEGSRLDAATRGRLADRLVALLPQCAHLFDIVVVPDNWGVVVGRDHTLQSALYEAGRSAKTAYAARTGVYLVAGQWRTVVGGFATKEEADAAHPELVEIFIFAGRPTTVDLTVWCGVGARQDAYVVCEQ